MTEVTEGQPKVLKATCNKEQPRQLEVIYDYSRECKILYYIIQNYIHCIHGLFSASWLFPWSRVKIGSGQNQGSLNLTHYIVFATLLVGGRSAKKEQFWKLSMILDATAVE